jgi:hypothetical protein
MDKEYERDKRNPSLLQCAGAAIFRANVHRAELMPKSLLRLPADTESVFASPEELLAHHLRMPIEEAAEMLGEEPPLLLLRREMQDQGVQLVDPTKIQKGE